MSNKIFLCSPDDCVRENMDLIHQYRLKHSKRYLSLLQRQSNVSADILSIIGETSHEALTAAAVDCQITHQRHWWASGLATGLRNEATIDLHTFKFNQLYLPGTEAAVSKFKRLVTLYSKDKKEEESRLFGLYQELYLEDCRLIAPYAFMSGFAWARSIMKYMGVTPHSIAWATLREILPDINENDSDMLSIRLRKQRESMGLTLKEVIRATKVRNLAKYESGELRPKRVTLTALAEYYGVDFFTTPTLPPEPQTPNDYNIKRLANKIIGLEIAQQIDSRKIVRAKMARQLGVSNGTLTNLIRCGYFLTADRLTAVLCYFNMSLEDLIGVPTVREFHTMIASDYHTYQTNYQRGIQSYLERHKYNKKKINQESKDGDA